MCHADGKPSNNFYYDDASTILASSAKTLSKLLHICVDFAIENLIEFSPFKIVVRLIPPSRHSVKTSPLVYLNEITLSYVIKLKYLGYVINPNLKGDTLIENG